MTVFDRILYDEIRASIMKATRASQLAVLFLSFSARTKKNTGGTPKLVETYQPSVNLAEKRKEHFPWLLTKTLSSN